LIQQLLEVFKMPLANISVSQTVYSGTGYALISKVVSTVIQVRLSWAVVVPFFIWDDKSCKAGRYFRGSWLYDPTDESITFNESNPYTGQDGHEVFRLDGISSDLWNIAFPLRTGMSGTGGYLTWWGKFSNSPASPVSWAVL